MCILDASLTCPRFCNFYCSKLWKYFDIFEIFLTLVGYRWQSWVLRILEDAFLLPLFMRYYNIYFLEEKNYNVYKNILG